MGKQFKCCVCERQRVLKNTCICFELGKKVFYVCHRSLKNLGLIHKDLIPSSPHKVVMECDGND